MATYYIINTIVFAGVKNLPGSLIDSTIDDVPGLQAAGALLWPSSDATVATAATNATNAHVNRGINETDMQNIMQAAVDASQKATEAADAASASPAITARVQKKTVVVTQAMIAALGAFMTGTINIDTVLPSNARLLGAQVDVATKVQNAGDTDVTSVDVGVAADTQCAIKGVDLKTVGAAGDGPAGDSTGWVGQKKSAAQLIATITSTVNLSTITAGAFSVDVFYFVLA